jgi:DNA-binding MarR family transcriptional regulator
VPRPSSKQLQDAASFRLALRHFHTATDRVVRSHGLTSRQYLLLLTVESWPSAEPATIGALGEVLGLMPSTMTEFLQRGEDAGLFRRQQSDRDGRVVYVGATAEGRRRMRRAFWALAEERRAVAEIAQSLLREHHRG